MTNLDRLRHSPQLLFDQFEIWLEQWHTKVCASETVSKFYLPPEQFQEMTITNQADCDDLPWELQRFLDWRERFPVLNLGRRKAPLFLSLVLQCQGPGRIELGSDQALVRVENHNSSEGENSPWKVVCKRLVKREDNKPPEIYYDDLVCHQLPIFFVSLALFSLSTHSLMLPDVRPFSDPEDPKIQTLHQTFLPEHSEFWTSFEEPPGCYYLDGGTLVHNKHPGSNGIFVGFNSEKDFEEVKNLAESYPLKLSFFKQSYRLLN